MKKLLVIAPVALAIGACNAEKSFDVMGVECEWVADGAMSTLVKCPAVPELIEIQGEAPNAMFLEGNFAGKHITEYIVENSEHILINIVPDDCGAGTTGYRVIVKEPMIDGAAMYAVAKCE